MSEIINRLKQAEQERERVVAERKRLEAEADAGLAEREREEFVQNEQRAARPQAPRPAAQAPRPAQPTPQQSSRLAAAIAMAAALAVVFWVGTLMPRQQAAPAVVAPTPAPAPAPARTPPELFKLERDLDAFASRVKE